MRVPTTPESRVTCIYICLLRQLKIAGVSSSGIVSKQWTHCRTERDAHTLLHDRVLESTVPDVRRFRLSRILGRLPVILARQPVKLYFQQMYIFATYLLLSNVGCGLTIAWQSLSHRF